MEDMFERVSKAIDSVLIRDSAGECLLITNDRQRNELARAAIEAMREPTQEMLRAGFESSPHDVGGCRDQIQSDEEWMQEAVFEPYQAMIDATLREKTNA